MKQKMVKSIV